MTRVRISAVDEFGRRLARERRRLGLTQADLAERLGLSSPETVSRYERGEREPRLSTILELAEALGISHLRLLQDEGANESSEVATQIRAYLVDECGFSAQSAELAARLALVARESLDSAKAD